MSLDINELVRAVKQAAVEAVKADGPMAVTLTEAQLILTNNVRDFNVDMTVDHQTESQSGGSGEAAFAAHQHAYKGRKTFKVHLALKAGEKVILISCDGGQKYIVLDRWEAP